MEVKAHRVNNDFLINANLLQQAWLRSSFGQYEWTLEAMEAALPASSELAGPGLRPWMVATIGFLQLLLGQKAEGRQNLEIAQEVAEDVADRRLTIMETLARANLVAGEKRDIIRGLRYVERAIRDSVSVYDTEDLANAHGVKAQLYLAQYDLEGDRSCLEKALESSAQAILLSEQDTTASWLEEYHYAHARVLRALGREEEADIHLTKALERVMQVAANTSDETLRRSWLENVPLNREIIAEARERGLEVKWTEEAPS
jgi:tetratricopeptide (TPR) repeat protein